MLVFLNHGKVVANTESIFEEERAAKTDKLSVSHNTNAVTKDIGFVHVVSG